MLPGFPASLLNSEHLELLEITYIENRDSEIQMSIIRTGFLGKEQEDIQRSGGIIPVYIHVIYRE